MSERFRGVYAGFAVTTDGALILLDECGRHVYSPPELFRVESGSDKLGRRFRAARLASQGPFGYRYGRSTGGIMTLSDKRLAPLQELIAEAAARGPIAIRWTIARKIAVVEAIRVGRLSRDGALTVFGLSDEELRSWEARYLAYGAKGLRATCFQDYRVEPAADRPIGTAG